MATRVTSTEAHELGHVRTKLVKQTEILGSNLVQYATLSFSCDSNRASFETWGTNQSKNKRRKEKNALNLGTFFKQRARYCRVSRPRKPHSCAEWDEDTYFLLAKSRTKPGRERKREGEREEKRKQDYESVRRRHVQ